MALGKTNGRPMSHFLGRRVMFSVVVLIMVIAALKFGFIKANNSPINATAHIQIQINTAIPHLQNASTKQQLEMQNAYL